MMTREALMNAIDEANVKYDGYGGAWTAALADAILAAGIIHDAGKPVVDVEALHKLFAATFDSHKSLIAALIAPDGPLQDVREVQEECAQIVDKIKRLDILPMDPESAWNDALDRAAAEIRAGRA